jgi:hypothetical protein
VAKCRLFFALAALIFYCSKLKIASFRFKEFQGFSEVGDQEEHSVWQ